MFGVNDYPWPNGGCPGPPDSWGWPQRECTSFVVWRMVHDLGAGPPRWRGDAADWALNAAAQGASVDHIPQQGSIVVFPRGVAGASSAAGHVGIALDYGGGRLRVESYNWAPCQYRSDTWVPLDPRLWFIHIGNPNGGVPTPTPTPIPTPTPTPTPVGPPSGASNAGLGLLLLAGGATAAWYWARQQGIEAHIAKRVGTQGGFGNSTIHLAHDRSLRVPGKTSHDVFE